LYSIDRVSNDLVQIDSANGQVTVVGNLGLDAVDVDLATLNGHLYAVNTLFTSQRADLLEIDPLTGAATLLGSLSRGADTVTHAEGLTSANGKLYASFTVLANSPLSTQLGELALTGAISNDVNIGVDLDGLGADSSGQIYNLDSFPGGNNDLYKLQPTALVGSYSSIGGVGNVGDIAFAGGSLFGISFNSSTPLHEINSANGALVSAIGLSRSGEYVGLATLDGGQVPEPGTFLLLGGGLVGLLGYGRRRRSV
jgi:hypothetical protein